MRKKSAAEAVPTWPGDEVIRWLYDRCGRSEAAHATTNRFAGGKLPCGDFGRNAGLEPGQLPRVVARSPSGRNLEVAAFPDGEGHAVRMLATESGTWTLRAPGGETVEVELEAQIDPIVRVDPAAPRVFTRADGRVFVPVGMNLG